MAQNAEQQAIPLDYQLQSTLFGCTEDWHTCCCGLWCPLVQSAYNKAAIDGRECRACDCLSLPNEYYTRAQIRSAYNEGQYSTGASCKDGLLSIFCCPCVVCQDARELYRLQGRRPNDWDEGELPPPPPQQMRARGLLPPIAQVGVIQAGPSAHYLPPPERIRAGDASAFA